MDCGAGLHPARRFSTGAGRPVYKRFGRVTNPPQVENLPHSSSEKYVALRFSWWLLKVERKELDGHIGCAT
jgi:hypothetical protein